MTFPAQMTTDEKTISAHINANDKASKSTHYINSRYNHFTNNSFDKIEF